MRLRKLNGDSGSVAEDSGMGGGCCTTRALQSARPDCSLDPLASQLGNNIRWYLTIVSYCVLRMYTIYKCEKQAVVRLNKVTSTFLLDKTISYTLGRG